MKMCNVCLMGVVVNSHFVGFFISFLCQNLWKCTMYVILNVRAYLCLSVSLCLVVCLFVVVCVCLSVCVYGHLSAGDMCMGLFV